jgi:hypothetical protein
MLQSAKISNNTTAIIEEYFSTKKLLSITFIESLQSLSLCLKVEWFCLL